MKETIEGVEAAAVESKKQVKTGVIVLAGVAIVALLIALFAYNTRKVLPNIVYQPTEACALLTEQEAKELLGSEVIKNATEPTISGNTATSKCSYSDLNKDNFKVAAVAVRNGINDEGSRQNKEEFAASRAANTVEVVTGLGDEAYFNTTNGQLNILSSHTWLILSYGLANEPSANTVQDAVRLANKVLETQMLTNGMEVTF